MLSLTWNLRTGALQPLDLDTYPGWVTGAKWVNNRMPGQKEMFVFSVHSPSPRKGERKGSYTQRSLEIVNAIHARVPATAQVVIGGDFNLASLGERLASESLPHDKRESAALAHFRSLGFSVAWRDLHHGQPLPQTVRWTGNSATPFHLDGFLVRGTAVTPRQMRSPERHHHPRPERSYAGGAVDGRRGLVCQMRRT